ncbi:MAG: hypothetical protein WC641_08200 [Patescibacteria group bacterium]
MLSVYHEVYAKLNDDEIAARANVKELGLRQVIMTLGRPTLPDPRVRVLVLGCADRRLIASHERIFSSLLGKPVDLTTLDVDIEHLQGIAGVIQHDAALPLPVPPYGMIYGDILVRFLEPAKQFAVLKNSWDALAPGGMAIHIFNQEDFDPPKDYAPLPGTYKVDLNALQADLNKSGIEYLEVPLRFDATSPDGRDMSINEFALVLKKK